MVQSRPLFVFSSFSYYNSNLNWKKQRVDDVLKIQTRGHRMVGADGSIEVWRMPELGIQNYVLQTLYQDFYSPTPTLMAFTGVTNAHGPSPQSKACRSPLNSLTTLTGSNKAFYKPHSHQNGFYWGHQTSWTLTPVNSMQVTIEQSDDSNRK